MSIVLSHFRRPQGRLPAVAILLVVRSCASNMSSGAVARCRKRLCVWPNLPSAPIPWAIIHAALVWRREVEARRKRKCALRQSTNADRIGACCNQEALMLQQRRHGIVEDEAVEMTCA